LVWLQDEVKTPPFSKEARLETGFHLRRLRRGEMLSLPHSRPMPVIGSRVHEPGITDRDVTWRIIYRMDPDAIIIGEVFSKKSKVTPKKIIQTCKDRYKGYDQVYGE
jgi:phage-related protein